MSDNAYLAAEPGDAKANEWMRAFVGQGPPNSVRWESRREDTRGRAADRACHSAALPVPAGCRARGGWPGRLAVGGRPGLDCGAVCALDASPVRGECAARAPRGPGRGDPPPGCEGWRRGARGRPHAMRGAAAQVLAPSAPPRHTRSPRARAAIDHPPLAARPPGLDPGPLPPTRFTDWITPRAPTTCRPTRPPASLRSATSDWVCPCWSPPPPPTVRSGGGRGPQGRQRYAYAAAHIATHGRSHVCPQRSSSNAHPPPLESEGAWQAKRRTIG